MHGEAFFFGSWTIPLNHAGYLGIGVDAMMSAELPLVVKSCMNLYCCGGTGFDPHPHGEPHPSEV